MLLVRIRMPNRPGTLGAVASALGEIEANINLVEMVEKSDGYEIDELILDLPPTVTVESLVAACDSLPGVRVEWVRNYPRGGGIEPDVDLQRRMAAAGRRAGETLVTAAPLVFRAQWSLLLDVSAGARVIFSSPRAPELDPESAERFGPFDTIHRVLLTPGWRPGWGLHHAVVAPVAEQQAVVVGRQGEPPFFHSELMRLAHLVGGTVTAEESEHRVATATLSPAHRSPVSVPLYIRQDAR